MLPHIDNHKIDSVANVAHGATCIAFPAHSILPATQHTHEWFPIAFVISDDQN